MENVAMWMGTDRAKYRMTGRRQGTAREKFPLVLVLAASVSLAAAPSPAADVPRVTRGLQALYTFDGDRGEIVRDRSGVGNPLDLKVDDVSAVEWAGGALRIRSSTRIRSTGPARKIIDAAKRTGAVTIEAWLKPESDQQTGPARIVSLSADPNQRNFTLGQDGRRYDVRLRTTSTSPNGIPSTATPNESVETGLTHVVYTRDAEGNARLYLNGQPQASRKVAGQLSNWEDRFPLILANESTGDRPWEGELHLVALYNAALTASEVRQNFAAGSRPSAAAGVAPADLSDELRVVSGLQALYTFDAGGGETIVDRSGAAPPLNLTIEKPSAVAWQDGALLVRSSTKITSKEPAKKIIDAVKQSGAMTVEAWVQPANDRQNGPARVVSLSSGTGQRNFTLGQDGRQYEFRLRTTSTSTNGIPSTATPDNSVEIGLTHVVYTRDPVGNARFYINGKQQTSKKVAGNVSNWEDRFSLMLANESTGDRPWQGELHLVAVYSRALSAGEVGRNFQAGANPDPHARQQRAESLARRTFETQIAPLLAHNCLECHDTASRKGGLDLSRQETALAGGDSGEAIVPGKSGESLLWKQIASGEMPPEQRALADDEKNRFRQWIDTGATWSLERIDPAVYVHSQVAGRNWVQRLTVPEYIETVNGAVGVDISKEAREILPPDVGADGFRNTAYNLNVDLKHIESYGRLAEIIVDRMDVPQFAARFSEHRNLSDEQTLRPFVEAMGKWLLRGPLDEREITGYCDLATTVARAGGDFDEATGYIIQAMLQSPRFIYRVENQRGDGTMWPAGPSELASRMSYIIWGGPPDEPLRRAADAGQLQDPTQIEVQVRRMLEDPRAIKRSTQFLSEWLNLDRLENLNPDPKRFPDWDPELASDMRAETLAFFKEVVWEQNRPLADLFNAQFTRATPRLARHYGLPEVGASGDLSRYDLSSVPNRGGLLTQGSLLTIGGDEASMVARGLFLFENVLRGTVKDPPPGIDTTPVPAQPGLSQRLIAEKRIVDVSCGGCHGKFEPLAFGLEKFDGYGAFHEKDEHGNRLREDGEILFPGAAKPVPYGSAAELMDLLAGSQRVRETITWKLTQFALGRPLGPADARSVEKIHETAQEDGGTYASLITAIVMSDLVQMTRTEP